MKIHFENKLVFIEYQNTIDDLVETIEKTIPDRIDNINISASLEFCNGYKNSNSLISNLNVILHIFMAGYLNEHSISRNIHRRFVFNDTNIKSQKIDKVIDIQIIQLLLLIIQFAKTGELTIQQEMQRHAVHMQADINKAWQSAERWHLRAVVLKINARKMFNDGYKFGVTENEVWCTEEVPTSYIYDKLYVKELIIMSEHITSKHLMVFSAILDILRIFADSEIGGQYDFDLDKISEYLNSLRMIKDYFECQTKEEVYKRFTNDIYNGFPVWRFLKLPDWTMNMVEKSFQNECQQEYKEMQKKYKCLTCKYYSTKMTQLGIYQECNYNSIHHCGDNRWHRHEFNSLKRETFKLKTRCKNYKSKEG